MGTKINLSKLTGKLPVVDLPTQRAPNRMTGLYLLALRSRVAHKPPVLTSRKQVIKVEPAQVESRPEPVGINRV